MSTVRPVRARRVAPTAKRRVSALVVALRDARDAYAALQIDAQDELAELSDYLEGLPPIPRSDLEAWAEADALVSAIGFGVRAVHE